MSPFFAFNWNFPSKSVIVPLAVFLITIETPGNDCLVSSSSTEPFTVTCCAIMVKGKNKINSSIFFIGLIINLL